MEAKGTILIVDDEVEILELFKEILEEEGYKVYTAENAQVALDILRKEDFDLILSDMRMPQLSGEDFLEIVRKINDYTTFIIMTAYGTIENAVSCTKKGAYEYLTKPIDFSSPKIWKVIEEGVKLAQLKKANKKLETDLEAVKNSSPVEYIITKNPKMLKVLETINKVANFDFPVLIIGESGTGKELIARAIHQLSPRKDKPFVAINCANISPEIMEAEFFGYKKGAFTGADRDKEGIIEKADGGTLFLDEIGEMPLEVQSKLLRFLQEQEVRKIGDSTPKKVDVRIVAATNKDLKKMVEEGTFREDLYYRLETVRLDIPPLRERKEDIPILVEHFIKVYNERYKADVKGITPKALEFLINYDWEGNIRQLENVIRRAFVFAEEYIDVEHLPDYITSIKKEDFTFDYKKIKQTKLDEAMKSYFKILLSTTKGNVSQAARLANIERQSLQKLLKKYQIDPEEFRS